MESTWIQRRDCVEITDPALFAPTSALVDICTTMQEDVVVGTGRSARVGLEIAR